MSNAQEAVKPATRRFAYFPGSGAGSAVPVGSSQTLPVVITINLLALIGILSSAFSVVRHADVLAIARENLTVRLFLTFQWLFLKSV